MPNSQEIRETYTDIMQQAIMIQCWLVSKKSYGVNLPQSVD